MDDTTLAKGLGLTDVEAAVVIPKLSPQKRATYERLIQWSDDWNRYGWTTGAIICLERR